MGSSFTQLSLKGSAQLTDTEQRFLLVGSEHLVKTHDGLAVSSTEKITKGATNLSVVAGATGTIWSVVASERFLVQSIIFSANINLLIEILDEAATILCADINARTAVIYVFPTDGYLSLVDGNDLRIKNTSGSDALLTVWAMGYRVTAAGLLAR